MELNFLFKQTAGCLSGIWDDAEKNTGQENLSAMYRHRFKTSATVVKV